MSSQLLVSVRNATEARSALVGGADIVDVKEPERGALGRADWDVIARVTDVVRTYDSGRLVSAAMGEICDADGLVGSSDQAQQPNLLKAGPAGLSRETFEKSWRKMQQSLRRSSSDWVAVSYADFHRCAAPSPFEILTAGILSGSPVLLIDTFEKDESTLLDWVSADDLRLLRDQTRAAGMKLALAGRVSESLLDRVLTFEPDIVAVRGAVCSGGDRQGSVDVERVRTLAGRLSAVPCGYGGSHVRETL